MVLKNLLKDEKPIEERAPTGVGFKIAELSGDVTTEKNRQISLIEEYSSYSKLN